MNRNENANLYPGPGNPPEYWDDPNEGLEDAAIAYVRENVQHMHDNFDVAPYVRSIDYIVHHREMSLADKEVLLAGIAMEILDAHVAAAIPMVRP